MSDQPDQIVDLSVRVPFGYKIKHVVARTGGVEPHADWSCTFVIKPAPEPRDPIDKAMDAALDLCLLTLNRLEKDFQQHVGEQNARIEKLEKHNELQDARAQAVAGRSINHEARLEMLERASEARDQRMANLMNAVEMNRAPSPHSAYKPGEGL